MSYWWSKTFISQIWRRFVLTLVLAQISVVTAFLLEGAVLVGHRLGTSTTTLIGVIDIVFRQGDPLMTEQVVDVLKRDADVQFLPGTVVKERIDPPPYPAMRVFIKTVNSMMEGKVMVSYQPNSSPMLWLQKTQPPSFALGIPFLGNSLMLIFALSTVLIVIGAALFMGWWIAKNISQPLLKLAEDALQMVEHKTEHITPEPGRLSEITVLADALNKMHADIYRMIEEREIFLAEISHDLRTPLSRLRVALEMLDSNSSEFVEGMKQDIDEMAAILKQTIALAHANLEENEPWMEGNINELLSEVHAKYQRAGFALMLNLADMPNMPNIRFKKLALTRLLYNLVDNGLKYGEGAVCLRSHLENNTPMLSVINTAKVSVHNDQTDDVQVNRHDGQTSNGLGLLIVERIARMHNMTLTTTEHADDMGVAHQVSLSFKSVV